MWVTAPSAVESFLTVRADGAGRRWKLSNERSAIIASHLPLRHGFVSPAIAVSPAPTFALAAASVPLTDLPRAIGKKLPRYPSVPTVRMGRLAVDLDLKGRGLGSALLTDAIYRAIRSEIAAHAFVVDAKDESAGKFYRHNGFIASPTATQALILPLATVMVLKVGAGDTAIKK